MHDHDTDLIAAVAEGLLDDDGRARADIMSCARCRAELADHETALAALRTAPEPSLSPVESTSLRAAVADAVGLPLPEPSTEEQVSRRRIPWPALAVAAASLAAIVGVVPVVGLLNTSGGDDAGAGVALDVADSEADAPPAIERGDDEAVFEADALPQDVELSAEPQTTIAAETTTTALPADGGTVGATVGGTPLTESDLDRLLASRVGLAPFEVSADTTCRDAAVTVLGGEAVAIEQPAVVDGRDGVVYVILEDGHPAGFVVLARDDCMELYAGP